MSSPQDGELAPGYFVEDRGPGLRSFIIVMLILTVASITLRFWSRSLSFNRGTRRPQFWWDDWIALLSVVSRSAPLEVSWDVTSGNSLTPVPSAIRDRRVRAHILHA